MQKPLSTWERLYNIGGVRKIALLVVLAVVWEIYARLARQSVAVADLHGRLSALRPTASSTATLLAQAWTSLKVLVDGLRRRHRCCRGALTILAITTRIGTDFLETADLDVQPAAGDRAAAAVR